MNNFEKKIASINNQHPEPQEGHRDRFEKKLSAQHTKQKQKSWQLIAYAATIVLLFSISAIYFSNQDYTSNQAKLIIENEEFIESELYYKQQIAIKIATIERLDSDKEINSDDLAEFDESLTTLKQDLHEAPGDPRVVEAVLNTYMLKIEALDNIVTILKKIS